MKKQTFSIQIIHYLALIIIWHYYNKMADDRLEKAMTNILKLTKSSCGNIQEINSHLKRLIQNLEMKQEDLITQTEFERNKLTDRLSNFDFVRSRAWKVIKQKGWDTLNQKELLSIASILASKCNISLDREAKRRKPILVKWFDENFDIIAPIFNCIQLEYEE